MLKRIGSGMSAQMRRVQAGNGATVTGLELDFNMTPSDWVGIQELAIYDEGGTNLMPALTAVSAMTTSLNDLAAGQFGTNSTNDTNEGGINEGWPAAQFSFAPGSSTIHWAHSAGANGIKIYVKFGNAVKIGAVRAILQNLYSYGRPVLTVKDQDNNVLTPVVAPQSDYDDIWALDSRYLAGSPTSQAKGLEWIYPDYVETRSINDVIGATPLVYISGDGYAGSGTLVNNGAGGTAYDFDLNGVSYVGDGDAHFLFDGSNIMKLANALSGAVKLDELRRTDAPDNDVSIIGMFRIPTWTSGKIICGTCRANPQVAEPTIGTSVEMITGTSAAKALGYGVSQDGVHVFHETSAGIPEGEDFVFGTAERMGVASGANNEYRGYISDISNNPPPDPMYSAGRASDNVVADHTAGSTALSSGEANSFFIGGIQNNAANNVAVIPDNSRMYEFIVFDTWLTRVQMLDLHKWLERKYMRIIRS